MNRELLLKRPEASFVSPGVVSQLPLSPVHTKDETTAIGFQLCHTSISIASKHPRLSATFQVPYQDHTMLLTVLRRGIPRKGCLPEQGDLDTLYILPRHSPLDTRYSLRYDDNEL